MYSVNYSNRVGSNTIKECATLAEAKAYCEEFFEGYESLNEDDECTPWCKLEIYTILSNGDIEEVYCTDLFCEKP